MKVEELMIGDWMFYVEDIEGNSPVQITGILDNDEIYVDGALDDLNYIKPIPLTAEILERNGFNEDNKDIYDKSDLAYRCSCGYVTGIDIWSGRGYIEDASFEYVHQLQHALRLLGIEKEFVI